MRKGLLAVVALTLLLATPAHGAKRVVVGLGDQKTEMFADARMQWLGVKHARLVVPWYVGTGVNKEELAHVDRWLKAARRAKVRPLVGFGHGFVGWTRIYLPKPAEYRRAVAAFKRRYPWVRQYIAWNEANHCSQPTCRRPERVAAYYDALKTTCRSCTVIGAAVIDQPNMVPWLKRFRRAAKHEPKVYGLHNYLDVNRLRSTGTRRLLRALPRRARVWITETGGVVRRKHFRARSGSDFPENPQHAGKVTRYLLRTASALPRIDRVYLYHWNVDRPDATWDSGLIDHRGGTRPGFTALARHLRRDPRQTPPLLPALPAPALPPALPLPPVAANPPPPEQRSDPPPAEPQQQQPASACPLMLLCDRPLGALFGERS